MQFLKIKEKQDIDDHRIIMVGRYLQDHPVQPSPSTAL